MTQPAHWIAILVITCVGISAGPARASDADLQRGISRYEKSDFDGALEALRRLAGRPGNPATRARAYLYIGLSLAARGGPESSDVRFNFRRALEIDATVSLDPARFPPSLVDAFEDTRKGVRGTLVVECDRANAIVEVAGESKTRCGFPVRVRVGVHRVLVSSADVPRQADVVVRANATTTVRVTFGPEPPPSASTKSPDSAKPHSSSVVTTLTVQPEPRGRPVKEIVGIALVAFAGAATAAGAVLGILANESRSDFENRKGTGTLTVSDALALESKTSARATAANILFVSAGATAVGGVVLLLLGKPSPAKHNASGFQGIELKIAQPAPGGGAAPVIAGRWSF
ncbi:MAG: tetratricopeptide repeat protein [Deltaproteobacteria bacterium]|nr:tetratricopeptide repeat protein [Deltaproteobacteria bacterium]